jgi:hypothetical protein
VRFSGTWQLEPARRDLRGADAIAVIGNQRACTPTYSSGAALAVASDGAVSLTGAPFGILGRGCDAFKTPRISSTLIESNVGDRGKEHRLEDPIPGTTSGSMAGGSHGEQNATLRAFAGAKGISRQERLTRLPTAGVSDHFPSG